MREGTEREWNRGRAPGPGGGPRSPTGRIVLMSISLLVAVLLAVLVGTDPAAEVPAADGSEPVSLAPIEAGLPSTPEARERERIRMHLERVEAELRDRDVGALSPEQRRNRVRHLDALREYHERGDFPRNLDFSNARVPYFVDDRGVHCAVGYLLHRDGRDDLVARIASTRNHATIPELSDDPDLVAWLDEAGLSLAEAARIQPMYCFMREDCSGWPTPAPDPEAPLTGRYAAGSIAVGTFGGLTAGLALAQGSEAEAWGTLATASGLVGVGLGAHGLLEGGDARTLGGLNVAIGILTTYVGLRSLGSSPEAAPANPGFVDDDEESRPHPRTARRVTLAPVFAVDEEAGSRVGLEMRIRQ